MGEVVRLNFKKNVKNCELCRYKNYFSNVIEYLYPILDSLSKERSISDIIIDIKKNPDKKDS